MAPPPVTEPPLDGHRRLRLVLEIAAATLAFAAFTVGGVVFHLDHPAARRLIARAVNEALADSFRGSLHVDALGRLAIAQGIAQGVDLTIRDPEGHVVIVARGVSARVSISTLVRSLSGTGPLRISIESLRVDATDVELRDDASGTTSLASTFASRSPAPPTTTPGRGLILDIGDLSLGHAWAHGAVGKAPVDADLDALGAAMRLEPDRISATLRSVSLHARALPLPVGAPPLGTAEGTVSAAITLPMAGSTTRTHAEASATVSTGRLHAVLRASLDGDDVHAHLEIPTAEPAAFAGVVAAWPITAPTGATFDVDGTLQLATVRGRADIGAGHVDLKGSVRHDDGYHAELDTTLVQLSIPDVAPGGPTGVVDGHVEATADASAQGALSATFALSTASTVIAGQVVPAVTSRGAFDGERLSGEATIDETGAPSHVAYVLGPEPGRPTIRGVDLDVQAKVTSLGKIARLGPAGRSLRGAIDARVTGHVTLDEAMAVRARVTANASGVRAGGATVAGAKLTAIVQGTARAPRIDATVALASVRAGGIDVTHATVGVDGAVLAPRVTIRATTAEGDRVDASARLTLGGPVTTVRGVEATLERNGEAAVVRVAEVRAGKTLSVTGIEIDAADSAVRASVQRGPGTLRIQAHATGIDMAHAARLAGPALAGPSPTIGGTVDLDTDVTVTPGGAKGFLTIDARAISFERAGAPTLRDVTFTTRATIDGRAAKVDARAELPGAATVTVTSDKVELGGSPLDGASFARATGGVAIEGSVDLARLAALLPPGTLPLAELAGTATFSATAMRDQHDHRPDLSVGVHTTDLVVETATVDERPGTRITGIELAMDGRAAGQSERVTVDVTATDRQGALARMHAAASPSWTALLASSSKVRETLLAMPLEATFEVPRRSFGELPGVAGALTSLGGTFGLAAKASGTVRDPHLQVDASAVGLTLTDATTSPLDVQVGATFAESRGAATASVSSQGRWVMGVDATGTLAVDDLLDATRKGAPRWTGGGEVQFSALPLRELTALTGRRVSGCLSGKIAVRGLNEDARLDADLRFGSLRVGSVDFKDARVTAHTGDGDAVVEASLVQTDGELTAKLGTGLAWGAAAIPTLDPKRPAEVTLDATDFRLSPLRVFVRDMLGNVDGRLSAHVLYRAGGEAEGQITLRDGVLDAPALGQELRSVQAVVTLSKDGEIRVHDASAKGITGRVEIEATAHLAGLQFHDAKAKLTIPKRSAMVLTLQGAAFGNVWGSVDVVATSEPGGVVRVDVKVPSFDLDLPDSASRSAQSLDDAPAIRIGTVVEGPDGKGRFVPLSLQGKLVTATPVATDAAPTTMQVRLSLANIRIHHGNRLDVWLHGALQVDPHADRTAVSGSVEVERGFVELQGRRFQIEEATATFDPTRPPADPTVSARATYEATDGTIVIAEFLGTAEKGKLALRSEPALSQAEILSLVVFGTRDAAGGQSTGGNGTAAEGAAASVGGGVLTQGLNRALSDVSPLEVTTRIDTTDAQDPRPEVGVAISRTVTASASYRLGIPTPGQPQDRSTLRLDYRFLPRWSLETSIGDRGTSIVDVVWKVLY